MAHKVASDYPQELLDLFHEYQHDDISRRSFLDGAANSRSADSQSRRSLRASGPTTRGCNRCARRQTHQGRLRNGSVSARERLDQKAYLARPATNGKLPAVLVIHENRGVNPYTKDIARRLALANFIAFAPDGLTSVGVDDEKGAEASANLTRRR